MENNSNEVAITCTLENEVLTDVIGISLGDEHSVDVCSDTVSNHLIVSGHKCAVVIMHNHPSTQTLSLEDIHFFLKYAAIKLIIVVTNQGKVHYLCKDKAYSYLKEVYMAGLTFLAHCSEAGLFYS